jgi:hypothetical protein
MISDRFRWAFCQLDTLRRCLASSIRNALDELPTTLDDTYERALQQIHKEKWRHAHRLFQCLVAAIRPLRVDELAEIFAIRLDADGSPGLMEGWRPENPEEALLSACSTLITIVENEGLKIVQFSHFSVKEYLTSDRLKTLEVGNTCNFYIPLDGAHTILARVCLAVLLQLDEKVDNERLRRFPLALYAARHWVTHAKFEGVALLIQDDMERLFNPHNPYLATWVWIYDVLRDESRRPLLKHPLPLDETALYYASFCGFSGVANYLICTHEEDVNAWFPSRYYGTPLRVASFKGHIDVVRILLDHDAGVDTIDKTKTPLESAYNSEHLEIMRLLLEHGADVDVLSSSLSDDLLLHQASRRGQAEVVHLLLQHNADVNSRGLYNWTPLHAASYHGQTKVVRLLLDRVTDINAVGGSDHPLHLATSENFPEIVQLLLEHGADVNIRDYKNRNPYQVAKLYRRTGIAQLLLEHGAEKE